jgi:hypothetical protein
MDGTQVQVGSELLWLWIAIEPKIQAILHKTIKVEKYARSKTFFAGHD